jgi:capsular polysaccharide transport system permease protein
MTTKPRARKFRIRRGGSLGSADPSADAASHDAGTGANEASHSESTAVAPTEAASDQNVLDAIRQEGLTGRQLRMARRIAQKHGLAVTSDYDAVRRLRERGIDPFDRAGVLELVISGAKSESGPTLLPQTVPSKSSPLSKADNQAMLSSEERAREIMKIQKDIARRRRQKLVLLFMRLAVFVLLPTLLTGYYYYRIATPMYATKAEFVIQQASSGGSSSGGGLGGLFQGTSMATQQDSITVQSYLASRSAMIRLDNDHGFKAHFSDPKIDPIQRLDLDATNEQAFKTYTKRVRVSYDPTEGIVRMEVIATDPATSQAFSEALVGYAEEQVDQLTARLRADQNASAEQSYQEAEARRQESLAELLRIQNELEVLNPQGEISAVMGQIGNLEADKQQKELELATLKSVAEPNQARVNGVEQDIARLESFIADLRGQLTEKNNDGSTLAAKTTELRLAEENYQFQIGMVQNALAMRESARQEADRQVRYLSMGVEPVAPDEATYPRAFENTLVSLLIFAGIYLMISLTVSILREQVSS